MSTDKGTQDLAEAERERTLQALMLVSYLLFHSSSP